MTVVDTSVWIDLFGGRNTPQVKTLGAFIRQLLKIYVKFYQAAFLT